MINEFECMIGKTFREVTGAEHAEEMVFRGASGAPSFRFYHAEDCCESVQIVDIIGDLADLVGSPIVEAVEVSNEDAPVVEAESYTWTFYRFSTVRGTVTVRWLGESNGYYSEGVAFEQIEE